MVLRNVSLKLAILRDGRKQYQIAAATGITETRLSRILFGRIIATTVERVRIASVLNADVHALFPSNPPSIGVQPTEVVRPMSKSKIEPGEKALGATHPETDLTRMLRQKLKSGQLASLPGARRAISKYHGATEQERDVLRQIADEFFQKKNGTPPLKAPVEESEVVNKQPFYHSMTVLFTATEDVSSDLNNEEFLDKVTNILERELGSRLILKSVEFDELDAEPGDPNDPM